MAASPLENEVILLGMGGHAKVVISVLQALNYRIIEAYDDDAALWGRQIMGVPVVGPLSIIRQTNRRIAVMGFGYNHLRRKIAALLPLKWLSLVHPSAIVHESVQLGAGTVVFAGAIIQPNCKLGEHVIVNTGATVDHDCVLGDYSHVSPGTHLAGGVELGEGAFMGIGSVAIPQIRIGAWTRVGAGGVVVRDLPPDVTAIGVPAHARIQPNASPAGEVSSGKDNASVAASTRAALEAEFIATDDARWTTFLEEAPHDFYHLPQYVQLEAEQVGGEARAFYARQGNAQFLIPLILCRSPYSRNLSPVWKDASSPYGYASPLLSPSDDAAQLKTFLRAFRKTGVAHSIVTTFMRLHPLLPLPQQPLMEAGQLIRHGAGVYFDLSLGAEEIFAGIRGNHHEDLRKLENAGFQVRMDEWEYYPQFIEAYISTMHRLKAEQRYFFSKDYFVKLRALLGDRLHLGAIFSPEGECAGGALFTTNHGIVQYHLMGIFDQFQRKSPSKLLLYVAQQWARERGEKYLYLGGGLGGREDSLFSFKAGFARGRADFYSYRMVLDPGKYQQLVDRWRQSGGQISADDEFFPLYRRPLS